MKELEVTIEFDVGYTAVAPEVKVFSSADSKSFKLSCPGKYSCNLMFNPECFIGVEFLNKDDFDDNWIEIKKILVDNIDFQQFIFKGKFYPVYNPDWLGSQEPKPPEFYCPGTQMRHPGKWVLPVLVPIFKTILNQWLDDER